MDAKRKASIEKKIESMDDQYWNRIADFTNTLSDNIDIFLNQERNALTKLIVLCLQIADTKYTGYRSLIGGHDSADAEREIENDIKDKLNTLEMERREVLMKINGYQKQIADYLQQTDILENQRLLS